MVTTPRSQISWTTDERQSAERPKIQKLASGVAIYGADGTQYNVPDVQQRRLHPQMERPEFAARGKSNGIAAEENGQAVPTELFAAEQNVDMYATVYPASGHQQALCVV